MERGLTRDYLIEAYKATGETQQDAETKADALLASETALPDTSTERKILIQGFKCCGQDQATAEASADEHLARKSDAAQMRADKAAGEAHRWSYNATTKRWERA